MKHTITLALALSSLAAIAQKPDTTKRIQFTQSELNEVYTRLGKAVQKVDGLKQISNGDRNYIDSLLQPVAGFVLMRWQTSLDTSKKTKQHEK